MKLRSGFSARISQGLLAVSALVLACLPQGQLWAQGCVMCRSSLAGQTNALLASLGWGILILLVPPLVIVSTILYVAFRRGT